jgi:multiple sugar transport system permease protein
VNNLWALVIAETTFQLPLSLILMSGFIRNIPIDLEEAAWVDGCSRLRGFLAVVLPLLRPALVAVGSFAFIGSWNNFLFALMFMSDQEKFTIPVGLSYTLGEFNVDFGALAAGNDSARAELTDRAAKVREAAAALDALVASDDQEFIEASK